MAVIPPDQKFHTIDPTTPTPERGSVRTNSMHEIYTMQDIIDSVTVGGGIDFIELGDTPSSYAGAAGQAAIVNATEDGIIFGAAGAENFTELSDTPANYTGAAGQFAAVNSGETGLEFVDVDLTDISGQILSYTVRDTPFSNFNDGEYEGETIDLGNNFDGGFGLPGLLYYWTGAVWAAADNTAVSTSTAMLGVLTNKLTGGNLQTVLLNGIVRMKAPPAGITNHNEPLYVATGAGVTVTAPTASGSVVRTVGHAFNSTDPYMIRFNPSNDWLEIV